MDSDATLLDLIARIRAVTGKLGHPCDAARALAGFGTSARGFMIALGCIQALKCNRSTCPTGITTHNPRLQRGLVAEAKIDKVARYAEGGLAKPGRIAQSVGVDDPRALRRRHVRIVQPDGRSVPMDCLFPAAAPRPATASQLSAVPSP